MSAAFISPQISLLAKCPAGLEEVLATELNDLGASKTEILFRAVAFEGDKRLLYAANYHCRTALRILLPVSRFSILTEQDLYTRIKAIRWEDYFSVSDTFAIDSTIVSSVFTHSHFVSQRVKDAIADRFREKTGQRPSVDIENPDFRINLHMNSNEVTVSFDSSGSSLHKRGYHVSNAEAPLSEVLAAGMILLSGWDGQSNFIDPMCGSGTLLTEAAMIAMNLPAGHFRESFGFMNWKDFDKALWDDILDEAMDQQRDINCMIKGSDISEKNLRSAMANLKQARLHKDVSLETIPFQEVIPPPAPGVMITNPPYGERIRVEDITALYQDLGNTLKRRFTGYQAWVISSDMRALKMIGLRPMKKHILFNGPLECRYAGFDLYDGSKKASKQQKDSD
ncbi:THUMP domain-containing protein [Lentimicrobium sp.]|jgi:putative N6-adenine-specific DNA methylase|uniref:THUMP domain-containing class I SAM-dependent RNA methyltransferase n=1 Tax=Lentimicrobium sp. TaxID=2034841 RepID=UPI002BDBB71A|nr:THUMP domain-containing protein [Lentimicrobium sp.]HPF65966.1 THUMP domain-containing protein [Lentimicrobium sp.]HPJ63856.1 THUMP domain-containing protein [Lentimicrobium sp.]HPR27617.1 THUMP domain-containing protein [Lentimicrobium sp.]HRW70692.1 THUMP domain-containing protein [Lentimicrobium sp.]